VPGHAICLPGDSVVSFRIMELVPMKCVSNCL
jgi:hypothetical protein